MAMKKHRRKTVRHRRGRGLASTAGKALATSAVPALIKLAVNAKQRQGAVRDIKRTGGNPIKLIKLGVSQLANLF